MERKAVSGIMLTLLLVGTLTLTFSIHQSAASSPVHNIDTGKNYTTIQAAIDAPETKEGHTIKADAKVYSEHVTITKSIFLVGENRDTTIIDGDGRGNVLNILANNVIVVNFTIRDAGKIWGPPPGHGYPDSCVFGNGIRNIRIENNTVTDAAVCVWFSDSLNVSISDNIVLDGFYAGVVGYALFNSTIYRNLVDGCGLMGLHLDGNSVYCKIVNNTVINNLEGIELERSAGNLVEGNCLIDNNVSIVLNGCSGLNVFRRNNMTSHFYNLIVWGWSLKAFVQEIDASNIANNETVYYLTNRHNLLVNPSNYPDLGYLAVVNCTNITIRDIDLSFNGDGMLLAQSTNCTLANITLRGNHGPLLHGGLTFFKSNDNLVVNNRISNNRAGVCLYQSDGNVFYHNSFVDNNIQVISNLYSPFSEPAGSYSMNRWDDGYPSGGNYWSDYIVRYSGAQELDGSGIWDTPYEIDENNQDNYPLIEPWTPLPRTIGELKTNIGELGSEGEVDNQGIVKSLIAKLNVVLKLLNKGKVDEAKKILEDDFITQVQNLSGIHITPEAAVILIKSAEYILYHL